MDELTNAISEMGIALTSDVWGVWFLIGAALVFFMQCGFAMVETGFTRAKNAGNIIMKNLMDFCIGTVVFVLLGYSLMFGTDVGGIFGTPGFDVFTKYDQFGFSNFVFNLVFCATAATIVSGAMAERTKFISYCIYSGVISAVIYPVEAHWIWGGGWLSQMGFHDFAGSTAIHMVGGISALIGAAILGPRIGKFTKKKDGSLKVNAIPGHSLTLGALGVFILWFGWYGFNGAAATSIGQLGSIFLTTTVAPAVATVVCMIFTWVKYGKPDVSMCLNASLAGLVAITAPCDVTDALGSAIIGAVAGVLVVFGVWLLDHKLHIDDPVGAVAVHCLNGIWGTFAVGLFATSKAPGNDIDGLFYGGGFHQLGTQFIGFLAVAAWAAVTITIVFLAIKNTIGLRASEEEEIQGLDATEHNLPSAYADFMPVSANGFVPVQTAAPAVQTTGMAETKSSSVEGAKLTKVSIICNQSRFEALKEALNEIGVMGITVTQVLGCGVQKGGPKLYRGVEVEVKLLPKVKVEVIVSAVPVEKVIETARKVLYTGNIGDGKIFLYNVEDVIKVRTGETGYDALQGVED